MTEHEPPRETPTLNGLTKDSFGRLRRTERKPNGKVYTAWDAAGDTARAVENPGITMGRIMDEDPYARPREIIDGYFPAGGSKDGDMRRYAQGHIESFVIDRMYRAEGAEKELVEARDEASDKEDGL